MKDLGKKLSSRLIAWWMRGVRLGFSLPVCFFLFPLSCIYGVLSKIVYAFDLYHKKYRSSSYVISVGNFAVGGRGKTPIVSLLFEYLRQKGYAPTIVTRGYGSSCPANRAHYVDLKNVQNPTCFFGDEPVCYAHRYGKKSTIVSAKRKLGALLAEKEQSDFIILDDALQNKDLEIDLHIVCMHASDLRANYLPLGVKRISRCWLKKAHLILLHQGEDLHFVQQEVKKWTNAPVIVFDYCPQAWFSLASNTFFSLDSNFAQRLKEQKGFVYCAIGSPEQFYLTLEKMGLHLCGHKFGIDHQRIDCEQFQELISLAERKGADYIAVTRKDEVKFAQLNLATKIPIYALEIGIKGHDQIEKFIGSVVNRTNYTNS